MLRPSRRDQLALEPLLLLIDREITADPEQRDPARRAARRHEVAQATLNFKSLRVAEEVKKDRELRTKLNGMSTPLTRRQVTDVSVSAVAMSPLIPFHRAKQPTARLVGRAETSTKPLYSDDPEQRYRVLTDRTPLTRIASTSFQHCLSRFLNPG